MQRESINDQVITDLDFVQNHILPNLLGEHGFRVSSKDFEPLKTLIFPYSTIRIVQVELANFSIERFYLKRVTTAEKNKSEIALMLSREEKLLRYLNQEMPGEVVELIGVFTEQQIIVTRECPGQPLDTILNKRRFWWLKQFTNNNSDHDVALLCGQWLSRFHTLTRAPNADLSSWHDYLSGEMQWRIDSLSRLLPQFHKLFEQTLIKYDTELQSLSTSDSSCSYHGDFAPHNIFFDGNHIRVIDFYGARSGHYLMDIVNFIGSVASRAENHLYPKRSIEKFCERFILGYRTTLREDTELLILLLVLQSIKRLLVLAMNQPQQKRGQDIPDSLLGNINYLRRYLENDKSALLKGPWLRLDMSHAMQQLTGDITDTDTNNPQG